MLSRTATDALFIATLVALYVVMVNGVRQALAHAGSERRRAVWVYALTRVGVTGWLAVIGILAQRGAFADFSTTPPRIAFAIVPSLFATLVLGLSPGVGRLAQAVPLHWPIAPQAF